jgi:hypothetical protein
MPAARTLNCDLLIHQAHRLTLRRQISQLEGRAVLIRTNIFSSQPSDSKSLGATSR